MSDNDIAVNDVVAADASTTESAPVTETKSEVAETPSVQREDGQLVAPEPVAEEAPKADDTAGDDNAEEPESQPQGEDKPLAPKSENRFQQLANQNRELKEQLQRLQQQDSQFATEQELLNEINPETGDYYTPQEAERLAFTKTRETQREQIAQQRYQLEVQQNQQTIASEAERALSEFPIFDENSPQYNAEVSARADALLQKSLVFAEDGTLVGSSLSPYELYKTIHDSTQANAAKYKADAQRSTERMLANADNPGSSQQGEKQFERLSVDEMAAKLRARGHDI